MKTLYLPYRSKFMTRLIVLAHYPEPRHYLPRIPHPERLCFDDARGFEQPAIDGNWLRWLVFFFMPRRTPRRTRILNYV